MRRRGLLIAGALVAASTWAAAASKQKPWEVPTPPAPPVEVDARYADPTPAFPVDPAVGEGFAVAGRTHAQRLPCAGCHTEQAKDSDKKSGRREAAHWEVPSDHPKGAGSGCGTCHAPFEGKPLKLLDGAAVSFDQSYRVCAQCHHKEIKDWAGGAHGKRLHSWSGPRVVQSCTGCHDPHAPKFPKRLPATQPTLPN